jgi:hypothetical protein
MTKEKQMLNALKSVEIFLRNQDLSEVGMQVKGKVLEAIQIAEGNGRKCKCENSISDIEDASMCGNCGDDLSISMEEASEKGMTNIINDLIYKSACLKLHIETIAELGGDEYLFQAAYNMGDVIDSLNDALTAGDS